MDENRAIVLTPPGVGAIAVIRIAGPRTKSFLENHFSRPPKIGRCVYGEIRDGQAVIDDAIVVLLDDERGADLNVHGGAWVVENVLRLLAHSGFVVDRERELPLPDWSVDADDTLEREVQAHLPMARTREALRILLAQPQLWRDYIQQPAPAISIEQVFGDESLFWLLHPPRVAIVGPPNAGKSTLANQLFAQERSITADLPGTTRDWVGESANLDGLVVTLVDTPGLRQTHDPIERLAIDRSAVQIQSAELVVLVLDGAREFSEQAELVERFHDAVVVINKSDRRLPWAANFAARLRTTATRGDGVDALRCAIRRRFGCEQLDPNRPRWWTARQRDILQTDAAMEIIRPHYRRDTGITPI